MHGVHHRWLYLNMMCDDIENGRLEKVSVEASHGLDQCMKLTAHRLTDMLALRQTESWWWKECSHLGSDSPPPLDAPGAPRTILWGLSLGRGSPPPLAAPAAPVNLGYIFDRVVGRVIGRIIICSEVDDFDVMIRTLNPVVICKAVT